MSDPSGQFGAMGSTIGATKPASSGRRSQEES